MKPIKSYTQDELFQLIRDCKQPRFRAKQLIEWLYLHGASSYDEMTNVPNALRDELAAIAPLHMPNIVDSQCSRDGTLKCVLELHDGVCVEMVAIPAEDGRLTVCCSSQAGCAMKCSFCATGKEGFTRNLAMGEIVDQILIAQRRMNQRVTNVVVMGQGEPFLNYDNTLEALRILNHKGLLNIGARHITLSTCGVIPGIERFTSEPEQFTLAVSLHAAVQRTRDDLMPGAAGFTLEKLRESLVRYIESTNRRVTFEYAMIHGVNDRDHDLEALIAFCKGLLCHINLIPLNKTSDSPFEPSNSFTMSQWHNRLNRSGIETTIRHSRGSDIAGACGQLKNSLGRS